MSGLTSLKIAELMETSGVKFGTSGARGLVTDMNDRVCYVYTMGFLQYLENQGEIEPGKTSVAVAGDLRQSTDRIMNAVFKAITVKNYTPVNCGKIPSPAVANYGLIKKLPAIMVTGSHIPDDRNGIKFNKCSGEILKSDELALKEQTVEVDESLFDDKGMLRQSTSNATPESEGEAGKMYCQRYISFFGKDFLTGRKIIFYQHSAVGREMLPDIIQRLGASVTLTGFEDKFIPVDTEAIRPEDADLAHELATGSKFDAIFSTDGDSDRPLVSDEKGNWLRGDIAGILTSQYLESDSVVTPVSCNTALEACGSFKNTVRTQIGSPYVIAAMDNSLQRGFKTVTGYEANGGYLTNSDIEKDGNTLPALPTRDPLIVLLCVLGLARDKGLSISQLVETLPSRFTVSGRLKEFPTGLSGKILAEFNRGDFEKDKKEVENLFSAHFGKVISIDITDGTRITFENGDIVHLRPSGNAPEFRCYNEAKTEAEALKMNKTCLEIMEGWRKEGKGRRVH